MIVYRVASGKAWSKDTHAAASGRTGSSAVQLSTLRVAHSVTFDSTGDRSENGVRVTEEVSEYVNGKREISDVV